MDYLELGGGPPKETKNKHNNKKDSSWQKIWKISTNDYYFLGTEKRTVGETKLVLFPNGTG